MDVLKNSRKFPGKHLWWYMIFDYTNKQKLSTKNDFFAIFSNISEHLRAAASEVIKESSLNSFLFDRSIHSLELLPRILKNRVSAVYQIKLWARALKHKEEGNQ